MHYVSAEADGWKPLFKNSWKMYAKEAKKKTDFSDFSAYSVCKYVML